MKLLTLNCHSWQEENQIYKIRYLAKTIYENNYDIIAFQEVSQLINSKIAYDNVKEDNFVLLLNNELKRLGCKDYKFYFEISHIGYDIYEEGICILTKLPIVYEQNFIVSQSSNINSYKTRKIVKLTLDYNNREIDIYSCHLGWWDDKEESFKYQVDTLMKNTRNVLSFFMGDFNNNAYISNEGYDYILKYGLLDTYTLAKDKDSGVTVEGKIDGWDKNKKDMRLDIIFTNKDIDVEYSNVIFNSKNKEKVSDHYGVEIKINI